MPMICPPGAASLRVMWLKLPSRYFVRSPVSWPIHRFPSASSNRLVTQLLVNCGVLLVSKIFNRTDRRADPALKIGRLRKESPSRNSANNGGFSGLFCANFPGLSWTFVKHRAIIRTFSHHRAELAKFVAFVLLDSLLPLSLSLN